MAELKKVEVEVTKEAYELGKGVTDFVQAIRVAVADGWQMGEDLPAILTAAMSTLIPAVSGVEKLGDEVKELEPFVMAFVIPAKELAFSFVPKKDA